MELKDYVDWGTALLDEYVPGWEEEIHLPSLDLSSGCNCVVGQLFGQDYVNGLRALGLQAGAQHGFDLPDELDKWGKWEELTALWREVIENRRALRKLEEDLSEVALEPVPA